MSIAAINPKGSRQPNPKDNPNTWAASYLGSTVGQKVLVGITGAALVGFLVFHMIGNLKMFAGQESINKYGYFLKHDLGALIWIARGGLVALFFTHFVLAIRLSLKSRAARKIGYQNQRSAQASLASKSMLLTGLVTLLFVIFHIAHYTFGLVHGTTVNGEFVNYLDLVDSKGHHDVYSMVVAGFTTPWICILYLVCQLLLFVHLSHGIASALQTLGLVGRRFTPLARALGWGISGVIFVGNLAIVVGVWVGVVKPVL